MRNPPPAAQWLSQIEGARSASDLVRVLRDYVAALTQDDRARFLPDGIAQGLSSPGEVQEWAVTLAHWLPGPFDWFMGRWAPVSFGREIERARGAGVDG